MRDRLERRRLTLRAAALCIVLVLLCGCLLPAFAEGPERTDSVPDQTWDEEIEDEPAWDEEEDIRTESGASARGRRHPRRGGRAG